MSRVRTNDTRTGETTMSETNAVAAFFKKYDAVPTTDRGVEWDKATTDALLGWLDGSAHNARAGLGGHHARKMLRGSAAECWRRVGVLYPKCAALPAGSPTHNELGRVMARLAAAADVLKIDAK
jgi:hypothetical protein